MVYFRILINFLFTLILALNAHQLIQGRAILRGLEGQLKDKKIHLNLLQDDLTLIKEQTKALAVCDVSVDYLIRYDFGLKRKNDTFVFFDKT